MDKEITADA